MRKQIFCETCLDDGYLCRSFAVRLQKQRRRPTFTINIILQQIITIYDCLKITCTKRRMLFKAYHILFALVISYSNSRVSLIIWWSSYKNCLSKLWNFFRSTLFEHPILPFIILIFLYIVRSTRIFACTQRSVSHLFVHVNVNTYMRTYVHTFKAN